MCILNEYPINSKYLDRQAPASNVDQSNLFLQEQFAQDLHYLPFHHKIQRAIIKFWDTYAKNTYHAVGKIQQMIN